MMTKTSWMVLGALAMAGTMAVRRWVGEARPSVADEMGRCEAILRGLDARCAAFR